MHPKTTADGGQNDHHHPHLTSDGPTNQLKDTRDHVLTELVRLVLEWTTPAMFQRFAQEADVPLDPADISHFYLLAQYGRMHPSELAARRGIGASAVSKLIGRLTEVGYVRREPDPADRRATYIVLTDDGQAAAQRFLAHSEELMDQVVDGWTDEELTTFAALTCRISRRWEEYHEVRGCLTTTRNALSPRGVTGSS